MYSFSMIILEKPLNMKLSGPVRVTMTSVKDDCFSFARKESKTSALIAALRKDGQPKLK